MDSPPEIELPDNMDTPPTAPASNGTSPHGSPIIYSAIYSGVPVYEMMCKNTPVMRRMADAYMNATQILKVAGFSKPKRTKILEREVLSGEHEKIQGGYGKYQGTWIPLSESRQLAARHNVDVDLRPLFDFDPRTGHVAPKPAHLRHPVHIDPCGDIDSPNSPSPPLGGLPDFFSPVEGPGYSGYISREGSTGPNSGAFTPLPPAADDGQQIHPPEVEWREPSPFHFRDPSVDIQQQHRKGLDETEEVESFLSLLQEPPSDDAPTEDATTGNALAESSTVQQEETSQPPPAVQQQQATAESVTAPQQAHALFDADYYQKLQQGQQGLLFDEATAANYVAQIQNILRAQDLQHYQQAQQYTNYLQSGAFPAVQSAYQQLATLHILSLAAQHAYTYPNGYPSLENWFKLPEIAAKAATALTTASGQGSSPEEARIPQMNETQSAHDAASEAGGDDRSSSAQMRQREVLTNLYLYSDSHLHKIIDAMKPSGINHRKPDVDMVLDDKKGSTLMHFAAALGRAKLIKALISHGADPSIMANGGETPLMRAVYHIGAYDAESFEQIADLLRDSVYLADNNKRTVLHHVARAAKKRELWAAATYYCRILAEILQQEYSEAKELIPQVVDAQDCHGNTALHYACKYSQRSLAQVLLRLGANHELPNNVGDTPVDFARYDPRLLSMLFKEAEKDAGTTWDELDEDADLIMRNVDMEIENSDYDDFSRSPSPNPVERTLHEQTMHQLDTIYGEKVDKILSTLTPNGFSHPQLRNSLLTQFHRRASRQELTEEEFEQAKRQLSAAKHELSELQEKRRRMDELCQLAGELETKLEEHNRRMARKKSKGKDRSRMDSDLDQLEEGVEEAMELPDTQPEEYDQPASQVSTTSNKRRRDSDDETTQQPTKHRRLSPPPSSLALTRGTRSSRQTEARLKTECETLQTQLSTSEQSRIRMVREIGTIRRRREEKDRKFTRIIAACVRVPVERVEEVIGGIMVE